MYQQVIPQLQHLLLLEQQVRLQWHQAWVQLPLLKWQCQLKLPTRPVNNLQSSQQQYPGPPRRTGGLLCRSLVPQCFLGKAEQLLLPLQ
jgi:hypothetical protein